MGCRGNGRLNVEKRIAVEKIMVTHSNVPALNCIELIGCDAIITRNNPANKFDVLRSTLNRLLIIISNVVIDNNANIFVRNDSVGLAINSLIERNHIPILVGMWQMSI